MIETLFEKRGDCGANERSVVGADGERERDVARTKHLIELGLDDLREGHCAGLVVGGSIYTHTHTGADLS